MALFCNDVHCTWDLQEILELSMDLDLKSQVHTAVCSITKHKAEDLTLEFDLLLINVLFPLLILPMMTNDS